MRDLSELNINEGGLKVDRPPPPAAMIGAFEAHFGVKLPSEYVTLLRYSNGGCPEVNLFSKVNDLEADGWSVDRFYYLGADTTAEGSLWVATEAWRDVLGKARIAFANDGVGNQFFIDCSTSTARIGVCVHDDAFRIVELASSFAEFIDCLVMDEDLL